jgi:calcium-dependent protein kinase
LLALGVITFLLLSGDTPFGGLDGENLQIVKQNIMRAQVTFEPENKWAHVSDEGKTFVKSLLCIDVSLRPTAKEAQRSNWMQYWSTKEVKEGTGLSPKTIGALINFQHSTEMQKLLSEVVSFTLLPEQIVEVRKDFEKLDSHGDGEITLGSLKRTLIQNDEFGSGGALSEADVEEMFVSIKLPVRRAEPTIRWHEFLAANLSQSKLDDRNLRLAFDRLDTQRKGFITFDDLSDILGTTTDREALEKIWEESLSELTVNTRLDRITLDDFKKILNKRPKDGLFVCVQRFQTALCNLHL